MIPLVVVGNRAAVGNPEAPGDTWVGDLEELVRVVARLEAATHPRWLVSAAGEALQPLLDVGVRVQRCWDIAEVHRILHGGWAADLGRAWAGAHGLDLATLPTPRRDDLFDHGAADLPTAGLTQSDGHLRPGLFDGPATDEQLRALATVLSQTAALQEQQAGQLGPRTVAAAHSESAAAVLCVELAHDGLPIDRQTAEDLISRAVGPRPRDEMDAARVRAARDNQVLRLTPGREQTDLRNPVQVRELLGSVGVTVPNTRAHVLQPFRTTHPLVEALLQWRKDERIATTYGYRWLDDHVHADGRLRGGWTACDGAAGRMTAQNGLHNLPAQLRPAVAAEPGHVLVRADLGQIEPRVLAVVSGDRAFAEATLADDLYAPVAAKLGVERPVAKVAVLAAMYGQRSGAAGRALGDLERAYPVAMGLLDDAYESGVARRPLRTWGGRRINLDTMMVDADDGSRGRFARNAVIQGSAAELFKAWAATVRHATTPLGAQIVLCLHDELLVQVPEDRAGEVLDAVGQCLTDSARRWSGRSGAPHPTDRDAVRFVADTSVVHRWSEAKG